MPANKVALITGAGSGIGRASAIKLQAAGYHVVLSGRRADELEKTAAQMPADGGKILVVPTDVSDQASVKATFAKAQATFGRLDVLFNNAGTFAVGKAIEDIVSCVSFNFFSSWSFASFNSSTSFCRGSDYMAN